MWIEIFRSGLHKDSAGRSHEYSADDIEQIAAKYNTALDDDESKIAPLVKGHPESNEPAYGWVERLGRRGDKLYAKMKELSPEIVKNVRDGMFKKISIALYPDLMLRHVGLLGAVPPAVKGMRNVELGDAEDFREFALEDYYCVINPVKESGRCDVKNHSENSKNEDKLEKDKMMEYEEKIALLEKEKRLLEYREYVNSMISAKDGAVITPAQGELLIDILEQAHFADNGRADSKPALTDLIMAFVSKMKPGFNTQEFAVDGKAASIEHNYTGKNVAKERLNLHEKALEIKMNTPGMAYEEAVCKAMRGE
jgi:hypothetical protein